MYYINDLYTNKIYSCVTKTDLIRKWTQLNGTIHDNFINLNVTGKDVYVETDLDNYYTGENGHEIPVYRRTKCLRRYQTLDKNFKSVDIRDWDTSLWTNAFTYPQINHKQWCHNHGRKQHRRRIHGPSFHRHNIQILTEQNGEYDIPCIRRKVCVNDTWDYYERAHDRHYTCSKCWKDQKKIRHQWQKNAT